MSLDIVQGASSPGNPDTDCKRLPRRGEYDYAKDGRCDEEFEDGVNVVSNSKAKTHRTKKQNRNTPPSAFANLTDDADTLAAVTNSARLHDEPIDNESDNPSFILLQPAVCALAGGGVAALVLELVVYWTSPAADGMPRARPQRDIDRPTWPTPGLAKIAQLIGLDTHAAHRAAEKRVSRAVKKLIGHGVIEKVEADLDEPASHRDGRSSRRLELRLTAATSGQLQDAGLLLHAGQHGEASGTFIRVWTADVRQLGVNEAIVLGQLWYRCVVAKKTFRVKRLNADWFPISYPRLSTQTGLTVAQVRVALGTRKQRKDGKRHGLLKRGLVTVEYERFRGSETMHFQIKPAARKKVERMRACRQ